MLSKNKINTVCIFKIFNEKIKTEVIPYPGVRQTILNPHHLPAKNVNNKGNSNNSGKHKQQPLLLLLKSET